MIEFVGLALLWIVAGLLALLATLLALALLSRIHLETSLAADPDAPLPAAGWARVRWLQLRGRLELPELRLRVSFLGIPLVRTELRRRGAEPDRGAKEEQEDEPEKTAATGDAEEGGRRRRLPRIRPLRAALRALRRAVRLERLDGELVLATPDPALTGELFGWGCALAAALPRPRVRSRTGDARAAGFRLGADFTTDLPRGHLDLALSLSVARAALAAWRAARAFDLLPFGRRRKG